MSKAIFGAVLLAGAATALGVLTGGLSFAGLMALTNTEMSLLGAVAMSGVAMEAGAIASALTSNRGMAITTRQAAAARQVIWGQQRVGGVQIYQSTTGSSHDQYNLVIVVCGHVTDSLVNLYLDGRQVFWQGSGDGWTVRNGVGFGGIADGNNHTGPNGVQYNFGGTGHSGIYVEARYGDQLEGDVIGALTANDPNWAEGENGSPWVAGCTYIYLKIEYSPSLFPTFPEVRITVNGKSDIYDPRTNTVGFSTNWALLCADAITNPTFGLGDNSVNEDQLIAAANVCDELVTCKAGQEARYTTHYHTDTTAGPGDILAAMMPGAAGRLSRIGGEWFIWPAYWQGPSFTFDDNALTGSVDWNPTRKYRDLINRVNGTYIAPNFPYNIAGNLYDANGFYEGQIQNNFPFAWQSTNAPQYAFDVLHGYATDQYLIDDTPNLGEWSATATYAIGDVVVYNNSFYQRTNPFDGETFPVGDGSDTPDQNPQLWTSYPGSQHPMEMTLQTCISVSQWQRVAKINLLRNRQQGTGTFNMNLAAWGMQPCDVMHMTFPAMGWTEKVLEVVGVNFTIDDNSDDQVPSIRASLRVQETDASVYEWSPSEELTVYDVPATPTQTPAVPAPPTNMELVSGAGTAIQTADGVLHPRIEVTWNTPEDARVTQIQVQYALTSNPTAWLDSYLVDVANTAMFIPGVVAGQEYNVRIRSLRASGVTSPWVEIDGYTVSLTLSVVGILSLDPGSLVADAFDDGTADIIVSGFTAIVGNVSVAVLPSGPYTIPGLVQQTTYWVYYVDPDFQGGAITPIATQNTSDFINKPGYFLIDSITTPYCAASNGGGGTTGAQYRPSNFSDTGTRTTQNPTYAYDGSNSTCATVAASYVYVPPVGGGGHGGTQGPGGGGGTTRLTYGSCMWEDFPSFTTTASATLTVVASTSMTGGSVTITGTIGSTSTTMVTVVATEPTNTYTLPIPVGTDLSTISVQVTASAAGGGTNSISSAASVFEIYVQT